MLAATLTLLAALALAHIATPSFVVGAWPARQQQQQHQASDNACFVEAGAEQCGGHGKCAGQVCSCDPCWQGHRCAEYVDVHQPRFLVNNFFIIIHRNNTGPVFRAEATDDDLGMTCPLHGPGESPATCPCATSRFKMLHGADSTLFTVDNETGDVFLAEGTYLQPGREYHFTVEAHGLWVAGQEIKVGHDLMRAVVYVRPERGQQLLTNDLSQTPMHSRDKREVSAANSDGSLTVELIRVSPEEQAMEIGTAITYKAVVHLPSDIAWSRSIGVEISTDQAEAALALCQVRVSGVSGPLVSSFGPINTLQPQLYTHKVLTSMYVRAIFDFGVISLLEQNANESQSHPCIEMTFETVVTSSGHGKATPLQYIRATLTTDEAGAMAAIDLSSVPQQRRPPEEQLLAVQTLVADSVMSSDVAANFEWRVAPTLASGDLTVTVTDVTPNAMAAYRLGGLTIRSDDEAFLCLAAPQARLAARRCLLMDDDSSSPPENTTTTFSRSLAKLHLPIYVRRRTDSALILEAWLLPVHTNAAQPRPPFYVLEAAFSTSAGATFRSRHNVSVVDSKPFAKPTSTPKITVKAVSASEVPAGIPIVYQAKLQLPRGLYNLTMTVAPLTKGASVVDASLVALDPNVDHALLTDFQVHTLPGNGVVLLDAAPVLVRKDTRDAITLHILVTGQEKGVAKFELKFLAHPEIKPILFQADIVPYEAPIVAPDVAIIPYEDQALFERKGLLEFGIELRVPEGTCTKSINLELNSLFKGNGEVRTHLCQVTLTRQNVQQTPLDSKKLTPLRTISLGSLCASKRPQKAEHINGQSNDAKFLLRTTFQATSLVDAEIEGQIHIEAKMQLGSSHFWSGGVSTHLVDKVSSASGCAAASEDAACRSLL